CDVHYAPSISDTASPASTDNWDEACLALSLALISPKICGGIVVRAQASPVRQRWLELLGRLTDHDDCITRLPVDAAPQRVFGGLDLVATLRSGHPVSEAGLLARTNGGIVVAAMAERLSASMAAQIGIVLETGQLIAERDGLQLRSSTRFLLVALDEALDDEPSLPGVLQERMAFQVNLDGLRSAELHDPDVVPGDIRKAQQRLPDVVLTDEVAEALCAASLALGVHSARACILASGVARLHAAFRGRDATGQDDAEAALRLVLVPRARTFPETGEDAADDTQPPPEQDNPDKPEPGQDEPGDDQQVPDAQELADMLVEAAKALLPADLLPGSDLKKPMPSRSAQTGKAGALRRNANRGRPAGTKRGDLRPGVKLNVIETLRAAAPWQTLRRREASKSSSASGAARRIEVRKQDIRINRFQQHSETTTIFAVDASGSSALNRLAEAKGAVELLLADSYVRRDQVALVMFRGKGAEVLLPPTRSLVRAKRALTGMAGGGGTPLCNGLETALLLALAERRRGATPVIVALTDGQANIARDGSPGRSQARLDALDAARAIGLSGVTSLLLDISPRPGPAASDLAAAMGARFVPLPYANSTAVSSIVMEETRAKSDRVHTV
ncbi:MAG: magnesium chelatase subunit D, partial [Pseudomonadota bacterium]